MVLGTHQAPVVPSFATPEAAIAVMVGRLTPVAEERVPLEQSPGRVTCRNIVADRPSPPSDVSAMDGYAVRTADLNRRRLPVEQTVLPGRAAPPMPHGQAVRIMTGGVVPRGAQAVIKREDVHEEDGWIVLGEGLQVREGQNIRRRGENLHAGGTVAPAGVVISPSVVTALASFGVSEAPVFRRVRVAVMVTGDELLPVEAAAEDWRIRDSNGPALRALVAMCPWLELIGSTRVADERESLLGAVRERLEGCDALLVTGGVSAGTHDFVPGVLREAGCEVIFHKLPLRPGRPVLGAVGPRGQCVLGLPGNPQSVMTTARRIGVPALRRRAGMAQPVEHRPSVKLENPDGRTLELWWYRPVRLTGPGSATLVQSQGSGDVVASARSDGFVEVPLGATGQGPWAYYGWGAGG